jgi:hypothetical protein
MAPTAKIPRNTIFIMMSKNRNDAQKLTSKLCIAKGS